MFDDKTIDKIKKIKIVLTDVDGVLTDGGMYYTEDGLVMKKFNVKDGMGAVKLREAGFITGLISTDTNPINAVRGERLRMDYVFNGIWEKHKTAKEIAEKEKLTLENVAFLGDDINDLEVMKCVGFSASPSNAVDEVKKTVDYVCERKGGEGAYREFASIFLNLRKD